MTFQLVVFDLDGTLIDSRRDLAASANLVLAQYGAPPLQEDRVAAMVGEGARVLVERVLGAAGIAADLDEAVARFLDIYRVHLFDHTRPYPGVERLLRTLLGVVPLAVLTNKPQPHTDALVAHFGWTGSFHAVVGSGGPWPRKPAPDAMLALVGRLGADPATTLMVGDSWIDVATAQNAGTRCCVARYGFGYGPRLRETRRGDEAEIGQPLDLLRCIGASQ